jgi:hypothetical protein
MAAKDARQRCLAQAKYLAGRERQFQRSADPSICRHETCSPARRSETI